MTSARTSEAVVAVDVGGTTVKGLLRVGGVVVDRATLPTFGTAASMTGTASAVPGAAAPPPGRAFGTVIAVIDRLVASARESGNPIVGIGLCTPGVVDPAAGRIVVAVNLGWEDLPIVDLLRDRYDVPVAVDHDARAAARAEIAARAAAGRTANNLVFIPIGTGVSASLVVEGRLVHGAAGGAGELGHVSVRPGGEPCTCGQRGCVEAYASASSIRRRYRAAGGTVDGGTEEILSVVDSDPIATSVWAEAVDALGAGIAALAALLDPSVVVIGGGLGEAGEQLLVPLRAAVAERLVWRGAPRIEQSLAGAGAGLEGAALLAETAAGGSPVRSVQAVNAVQPRRIP
jgi:glucokinase